MGINWNPTIPPAWIWNNQTFHYQSTLGRGKDGFSYLVEDDQGHPYVIKQLHSAGSPDLKGLITARQEVQWAHLLNSLGVPVPELIGWDEEQQFLIKEYIPGDTVAFLLRTDALPEDALDQMDAICTDLYRNGYNLDYAPANFVVNPEGRLVYVDYDLRPYNKNSDFEHCGLLDWEILKPESDSRSGTQ